MLEAIAEIIFGFVGELLLEIVVEVLVEFGFHKTAGRLSDSFRSRTFVGLAYTVFGVILGFASLYVFPKIQFDLAVIPALYFIVSPIIAGFSLTTVSWLIDRGIGNSVWFKWDKFIFGVVFALGYSLSRVILG
ncbi:MAG: hypothetical protein ABL984_05840 [Pyrinomonadaceae bacterium]